MLGSYLARISITAAGSLLRQNGGVLDALSLPFRPWPNDVDVYGHVNNGRYLTLMDFGRLDFTLRTGMAKQMLTRRWLPVLGSAAIKFRKELKPFDRCELVTRFAHWDDKWFFFEQRFVSRQETCAFGVVKGVMKHGRQTISPRRLLEALGAPDAQPPRMEEELRRFVEVL